MKDGRKINYLDVIEALKEIRRGPLK